MNIQYKPLRLICHPNRSFPRTNGQRYNGRLRQLRLCTMSFTAIAAVRHALPALPGVQEAARLLAGPRVLVLEVGCDDHARYTAGHIPGALYLDAAQLESGPLFNKVDDDSLRHCLLGLGITHDSCVLVYGRSNSLAAARAAHLMLYAGVADVRLLDGGWNAWTSAGLACETGAISTPVPAAAFGAPFPARPDYLCGTEQVRAHLAVGSATLASIRTEREYLGQTSGYCYIHARGEIPGARWGRAGREGDVHSMSDYQRADGSMRAPSEIALMWAAHGIHAGGPVVFYCGTGWRASLAFFYAHAMGWRGISVYDGGWFEWSSDPANPVASHGRAVA